MSGESNSSSAATTTTTTEAMVSEDRETHTQPAVEELPEVEKVFKTVQEIVEWLVLENTETNIQTCFLLSYRVMITSDDLYNALNNIIITLEKKKEKDSVLSKLNMFLYMWGELSYHYDWKAAPDRLAKLMDMAKSTSLSPNQFVYFKRLLMQDTKRNKAYPRSLTFTPAGPVESFSTSSSVSPFSPPAPASGGLQRRASLMLKLRKSRSKTDDFMPVWFNTAPGVFAAQMTVLEHESMCTVKPDELIPHKRALLAGSVSQLSGLDSVVARFNEMAKWVATQVLYLPQPKMQAAALKRFVVIAEELLELNNFQSVGQIMSGLFNSSVTRLKKIFALLSNKTTLRLKKLEEVMSPSQNFLNLRELLKETTNKPVIPYMPLVLRDVTFICDGNPNKLADGSVNFGKLLTLGKYLLWFKSLAAVPYRLPIDVEVHKILLTLKPLSDEELYKLSLECEPKPERSPNSTSSPSQSPKLAPTMPLPPLSL